MYSAVSFHWSPPTPPPRETWQVMDIFFPSFFLLRVAVQRNAAVFEAAASKNITKKAPSMSCSARHDSILKPHTAAAVLLHPKSYLAHLKS